ncbi:hypothetical protein ACI5FR_15200 [Paenibacillus sp. HJGM_3]
MLTILIFTLNFSSISFCAGLESEYVFPKAPWPIHVISSGFAYGLALDPDGVADGLGLVLSFFEHAGRMTLAAKIAAVTAVTVTFLFNLDLMLFSSIRIFPPSLDNLLQDCVHPCNHRL